MAGKRQCKCTACAAAKSSGGGIHCLGTTGLKPHSGSAKHRFLAALRETMATGNLKTIAEWAAIFELSNGCISTYASEGEVTDCFRPSPSKTTTALAMGRKSKYFRPICIPSGILRDAGLRGRRIEFVTHRGVVVILDADRYEDYCI